MNKQTYLLAAGFFVIGFLITYMVVSGPVPPPPKEIITVTSPPNCFEYEVTIGRYETTLEILKERNPKAARQFEEIFSQETE